MPRYLAEEVDSTTGYTIHAVEFVTAPSEYADAFRLTDGQCKRAKAELKELRAKYAKEQSECQRRNSR